MGIFYFFTRPTVEGMGTRKKKSRKKTAVNKKQAATTTAVKN